MNCDQIFKTSFIVLINCILANVSFGQSRLNFDYKSTLISDPDQGKYILGSTCFQIDSDTGFSFLYLKFSSTGCRKMKTVDSVEFSPYSSKLHCFNQPDRDITLLIWETEFEFFSELIVYYVGGSELLKVGYLEVSVDCEMCDYFGYPISQTDISYFDGFIEFGFKEDLIYKPGYPEEAQYKAGKFRYLYSLERHTLVPVAD